MTGRISRILQDKGFGFIKPDDSSSAKDDVFFHRSGVVDPPFNSLCEGERVSFDLRPSPKGPRAEGVTRIA